MGDPLLLGATDKLCESEVDPEVLGEPVDWIRLLLFLFTPPAVPVGSGVGVKVTSLVTEPTREGVGRDVGVKGGEAVPSPTVPDWETVGVVEEEEEREGGGEGVMEGVVEVEPVTKTLVGVGEVVSAKREAVAGFEMLVVGRTPLGEPPTDLVEEGEALPSLDALPLPVPPPPPPPPTPPGIEGV